MKIAVSKINKLTNERIFQIIKLKDSHWNKGLVSQKKWFKKNIKSNDIHIFLLDTQKQLIGYNLLRRRNFFTDHRLKKNKECLYFDTLIIKKKYRGLNLSKKILFKTHEISKKKKLPMILICKKKTVKYYEKYGWLLLDKNNVHFLDHKFDTFAMTYCSTSYYKNNFLNKNINILINK